MAEGSGVSNSGANAEESELCAQVLIKRKPYLVKLSYETLSWSKCETPKEKGIVWQSFTYYGPELH